MNFEIFGLRIFIGYEVHNLGLFLSEINEFSMKKFLALMLALMLVFSLSAFAGAEGADPSALTVTAPSGAPALALATLAVENPENYTYVAAVQCFI